jgi:hypothetical protein
VNNPGTFILVLPLPTTSGAGGNWKSIRKLPCHLHGKETGTANGQNRRWLKGPGTSRPPGTRTMIRLAAVFAAVRTVRASLIRPGMFGGKLPRG